MGNKKGVSLIETILVVVVIGFIVILMANLPNAMILITKSKHLSLAREIAAKQIEDKRSTSYLNLVNDITDITGSSDPRMNLLPNSTGTVQVQDCDPSVCTNGEHVKQISVIINWKDNNKTQTINVETLIGEGGLNQ